MNLSSAAPNEEIDIVVQRDAGSVEETLMAFVGAYNGAMGFLNAQFAYDPADGGYAPPLNGDSAARQVDRDLNVLFPPYRVSVPIHAAPVRVRHQFE